MDYTFETKIMRLEDIVPADYNPRVTLTKKDPEYQALAASLDENGLVKPLIVNKRTGTLVSGHQRLNVMLEKGDIQGTEVVLIDVPPEQEKAICMELNAIKGKFDYGKLADILQDLQEADVDMLSTGFDEKSIDDILGGIPEDTDVMDKHKDEPGVKCKIGVYDFRMEDDIYSDMIADIRYKVGFTIENVNRELKRRLFDEG